uniref:Uncharacterized protein n=1 Tax=Anguilla anguilla TaxID=7936 RepID=A0A0E9WXF5_ANGAN
MILAQMLAFRHHYMHSSGSEKHTPPQHQEITVLLAHIHIYPYIYPKFHFHRNSTQIMCGTRAISV